MAKQVYYLKPVGEDGPIKVGCSRYVKERMNVVNRWCPFELEIAHCERGEHVVERILHVRYRDLKIHGEWFRFGGILANDIHDLQSGISLSEILGFNILEEFVADEEKRKLRSQLGLPKVVANKPRPVKKPARTRSPEGIEA